jgi:nitroreductase
MDIYEALYTTRAMRRMRPDPIPHDVQARVLDAAIRAPSGADSQPWHFVLVDDPVLKGRLGTLYRACHDEVEAFLSDRIARAEAEPAGAEDAGFLRTLRSSQHLANHFSAVPLLLFCFAQADWGGASVYPAAWSAMLAARAEGVGSVLTTMLSFRAAEALTLLAVPQGWEMICCVAMGYPTGRWGVAQRRPVHEVAGRNQWDGPLGYDVPEPLWPRPRGETSLAGPAI